MNEENDVYVHQPVLWEEIAGFLDAIPDIASGTVLDCNLGEGGHSERILRRFASVRVIGIERDPEILAIARERLKEFGGRMMFVHENFRNIGTGGGRETVSAIVYDFGLSSYHFEKSGRGFSFQVDEPLDMRFDANGSPTASEVINHYPERALADIIFTYGEDRWARKIAAAIVRRRTEKSIDTTRELADVIVHAIPPKFRSHHIHPATRVFQALRIVVNDELAAIGESLDRAVEMLRPGGRILAISYHSLEDRIVKHRFRDWSKGRPGAPGMNAAGGDGEPLVRIITKKPVVPGEAETASNRRARSAKLRVCERTGAVRS